MALRRQKRGTGCLSKRRALLKICFLVCSFPLRRIAVTGSCFLLFYFVFVSRRFPDIRIVYRLVICALTFFSLLTDSLSLQQCSFKAFIFFFSPLAGFTTMASFFLFTKILKKNKTRLSLLGFHAFISTYKPLSSTKPAKVVFKTTALGSLPLAFSRLWGHKPPCAFYDKQRQLEISPP